MRICCRFLFETPYWLPFPWTRKPLLNVILLLSWGWGGTVIIKDAPCLAPTPNRWNKQCLPGLDNSVFLASLTFTADIFNMWILQHLDWNNTGILSIIPFERLHSRFGFICAQPFSFLRSYGSDRDWISYISPFVYLLLLSSPSVPLLPRLPHFFAFYLRAVMLAGAHVFTVCVRERAVAGACMCPRACMWLAVVFTSGRLPCCSTELHIKQAAL